MAGPCRGGSLTMMRITKRILGVLAYTTIAALPLVGCVAQPQDPADDGVREEVGSAAEAVTAGPFYDVDCSGPACLPFNSSNSYVLQLAVTTAQNNHAPVGSTIEIDYYPPPGGLCDMRSLVATV